MEEKKLKILALQFSTKIGDKKSNFAKVEKLLESNINKYSANIDILVLPEVWNIGWKCSEFRIAAEDLQKSETINFLSQIAQKYKINIIGGSIITKKLNDFYNTCPVINREGKLITTYDKMHLFSYYDCDENKFVKRGLRPRLINIDGVKIGLSLCYDIRFPEIYRCYRKAGADLLINMAAWPKSRQEHWMSLAKARAVENQCYMLALTQSGLIEKDEWNLGHSLVVDYNAKIINEVQSEDEALFTELKFNEMYKFREKCTVLLDIHDSYELE